MRAAIDYIIKHVYQLMFIALVGGMIAYPQAYSIAIVLVSLAALDGVSRIFLGRATVDQEKLDQRLSNLENKFALTSMSNRKM